MFSREGYPKWNVIVSTGSMQADRGCHALAKVLETDSAEQVADHLANLSLQ